MTRPARIITWTLATLITLLAILVVVIATFDWNRAAAQRESLSRLAATVRHQRQPRRQMAHRA